MQIDFSKGRALHNLYGHTAFAKEAEKAGKDQRFISTICANLKCKDQPVRWKSTPLPTHI